MGHKIIRIMATKQKSIELLNKAVGMELTAVHQYMYFHFRCDDYGYDSLSGMFRRVAIEEMMHVEQLAERILFLKGDVDMKLDGRIVRPTDVHKMLERAIQMESDTVAAYNKWAKECGEHEDAISKRLFEQLLEAEETHDDQFDTELDNFKRFGDNYLALQAIERSKAVAAGTANAGD